MCMSPSLSNLIAVGKAGLYEGMLWSLDQVLYASHTGQWPGIEENRVAEVRSWVEGGTRLGTRVEWGLSVVSVVVGRRCQVGER